MRPQRTRASRTLGKTLPCSMTIPGSLQHAPELRGPKWLKDASDIESSPVYSFATQFGTSSTYPWSSMRGSRGKGSTKHWHLWWQTNSTSAWQIRNKAQTQTECFMHFTHCHGSPSPPSKPILQERNTSKQISATSELKLSFWRSEISIDIWVCVLWFRFWLFGSWIKPKQAINRSTTQVINPCKALDGWFCSLGLGGCEGLPLKELQAVCLWSV